jgi:hypothetical protein
MLAWICASLLLRGISHHPPTRSDGSDPPLSSLPSLLRELDARPEDAEHFSVAVTHESEWRISASPGGHVIFERLEEGGETHMVAVPEVKIIGLRSRLISGDIASLESEPWKPGYE